MDARSGQRREKLRRVVALLLALADLAERAAVRPGPFRWLVLWNLWLADAAARDFVAGAGGARASGGGAPALSALRCGHEPAEALALARSLRTLALAVHAMAGRLDLLAFLKPSVTSCRDADRCRTPGGLRGSAFSSVPRLDSS